MKNEELIKKARFLDIILIIFEIIVFLVGIFLLAFIIAVPFLKNFEVSVNKLDFGAISVSFRNILETPSKVFSAEFTMLPLFCEIALLCYGLMMFRKILVPLKEGHPFEGSASGRIRKLGILVIIIGIFMNVCDFVLFTCGPLSFFDLKSVFNADVVKNVTWYYQVDWKFILIAAVLFLLAHVFKYGEALQIESDETL